MVTPEGGRQEVTGQRVQGTVSGLSLLSLCVPDPKNIEQGEKISRKIVEVVVTERKFLVVGKVQRLNSVCKAVVYVSCETTTSQH